MKYFLFILAFMSFAATADEPTFVFDHSVRVYKPGPDGLGAAQAVTAGQQVQFDHDKVYWLEAAGKIPILVLPQITQKTAVPVHLQMPEVAEWPPHLMKQQMDIKLSELVDDFSRFQMALRKKNTDEAEKLLTHMQGVAQLDYLFFLRASLDFAEGNLESAKENVKKGLARYPANEDGIKFLKVLEGSTK